MYVSTGRIFGVKAAGKLGRQGGGPGFNYFQLTPLEKQSLGLSAAEGLRQNSSLHEGYQIRECLF